MWGARSPPPMRLSLITLILSGVFSSADSLLHRPNMNLLRSIAIDADLRRPRDVRRNH